MENRKTHLAALLLGSLTLAAAPAFAITVDPAHDLEQTPDLLDLAADSGYERRQSITESFTETRYFAVVTAGSFALALTDLQDGGALRKLGAFIADVSDSQRFVHLVGDGRLVFDLQPGMYSLHLYAKPAAEQPVGEFALQLQHADTVPAAVPVPAALWLLGSGLLAMAGATRRTRR